MTYRRPMDTDQLEALAGQLERLAERVRETPPWTFESREQNAMRDIPGDDPGGNYSYRVVEPAGPLETTITIRWQP